MAYRLIPLRQPILVFKYFLINFYQMLTEITNVDAQPSFTSNKIHHQSFY
jgi:hypothetical protein